MVLTAARSGRAPVGPLLARAERQPVYAEQDPDGRIPAPYFGFDGTVHRLLTEPERRLDLDVEHWRQRQAQRWQRLYDRLSDADLADKSSKSILLWQHALQAAHGLRRGWLELTRDELKRAEALQPGDRSLGRLRERLAALDAAWQRADTKGFAALWKRYATLDLTGLLGPD